MARLARDIMTANPACGTVRMRLDEIAKLMVDNDCGEIPILDGGDQPIGVITDRDIVCRVVAQGKNPAGHTAEEFMTSPVISVSPDSTLDEVLAAMESNQIRRILVADGKGCCGIISQADVAQRAKEAEVADLVRKVSA
jgi:CBS domain-containing protein